MRKRFEEIIQGWDRTPLLDNIPKKLKLLEEEFGGKLRKDEQKVVDFMLEVQQARESLKRYR